MTLSDYYAFLGTMIDVIPFSVSDGIFLLSLIIFVASERSRGIVAGILAAVLSTAVGFFVLSMYSYLSVRLFGVLTLSQGYVDSIALSFYIGIGSLIAVVVYKVALTLISDDILGKKVSVLSATLGLWTFLVLSTVVTLFMLAFPTAQFIKKDMTESVFISRLIERGIATEISINRILGKGNEKTIGFQTIPYQDYRSVQIYGSKEPILDDDASKALYSQLNAYRASTLATPLTQVSSLHSVAQTIAQSMKSKYSRGSINGRSLYDLLTERNLSYSDATFLVGTASSPKRFIAGLAQLPEYKELLRTSTNYKVGVAALSLHENGFLYVLVFTL